jgi:MerR family transcriptional regulator/heat shock protein HspR
VDGIQRDTTDPIYTLGVAAELSGTAVHSIRQYIDKGLIIPFKKDNKRHLFSEVDILRLQCIKKYIHEQGLNIAGIKAIYSLTPCWIIKPCNEEERKDCSAYYSTTYPCWEATSKGSKCKNFDCRTCPVYRIPENCKDPKTLFKKYLIKNRKHQT